MNDERLEHWDKVYRTKGADELSWFQPSPKASLDAIARHGGSSKSSLIDIGGGASSLVAELYKAGWHDLAVLDLSSSALETARAVMGPDAACVDWITADVTQWSPSRRYGVWHDRAVFHFLTEPAQRAAYLNALARGLEQGGLLLMATFAPDGPEKCSGLPVKRYSAAELADELGAQFDSIETWREIHCTPWGAEQAFTWCAFRKGTE